MFQSIALNADDHYPMAVESDFLRIFNSFKQFDNVLRNVETFFVFPGQRFDRHSTIILFSHDAFQFQGPF